VTTGANDGSCIAAAELPPQLPAGSDAGFWLFTVQNRVPQVTYTADSAHPGNGLKITFTDADCILQELGDDLKWKKTSLAARAAMQM
jgi:hypothetical protein